MKILHVAHNLGGGLETAIVDYVAAAPRHHHDLFYSTNPNCEIQRSEVFGTEIRTERSYRAFVAGLRKAVRELEPDVVHAQSSIAGALCRVAVPRASGVRIVYTPHCFAFERRDISAARRAAFWSIEAMLAARTSTLAACSPRELTLARRLGLQAQYVPNVARITQSRRPALTGVPLRVVACGRVQPQKDPGLLAEIARTAGGDIDFEWIGGGDAVQVAELEAAGVTVTGWVSREIALDRLARADVYVHTARWEGAPMTILEAAAMGVPVMARDTPAMRDLGLDPLWSEPAQLLELLRDPGAIGRAASNGVELNARHTADAQQRALERIYSRTDTVAPVHVLPAEAVVVHG